MLTQRVILCPACVQPAPQPVVARRLWILIRNFSIKSRQTDHRTLWFHWLDYYVCIARLPELKTSLLTWRLYVNVKCVLMLTSDLLQGREGRKHPADGARSGQTGGLRFCFDRRSGQLVRGDSLLVSVEPKPADQLHLITERDCLLKTVDPGGFKVFRCSFLL